MSGTMMFLAIVNMQIQPASDAGSRCPGFEPNERREVSFINTL